jgi:hypothetical protein
VGVGDWLRRIFSSGSPDDEAAEHEEYGLPDRGEEVLRSGEVPSLYAEGTQAFEDELDEFKAPPDPDP